MSEIFAPNRLSHWEPYNPAPRISQVADSLVDQGRFAELLLQHNTVAIPTADYSILPVLVAWFGDEQLVEAFQARALRLIRHRGSLGYFPGGGGLERYELQPSDESPTDPASRLSVAAAIDGEEAADLYLQAITTRRAGELTKAKRRRLVRETMDMSTEVEIVDFLDRVAKRTYEDIKATPELAAFFAGEASYADLRRLGTLSLKEMRVYRDLVRVIPDQDSSVDEVDLILWLGAANYEVAIAAHLDIAHLIITDVARNAMTGRARSLGIEEDAFSKLLEAEQVPDIPLAFVERNLDMDAVWRLRQSVSGEHFREWFASARDSGAGEDIRNAYIRTLRQSHEDWTSTRPGRLMRFLLPVATDLMVPGLGTILAGVTLAGEEVSRAWNPSVFIEDLRRALK